MKQILYGCLLVVSLALLPSGCTTDGNGGSSTAASAMHTSVPMHTLQAMYVARAGLISLADGSAEDPNAVYAQVQQMAIPLRQFGERMERLAGSFNDNDYMYFWDQLAGFGTIYQINTGTHTAQSLRSMEMTMRGFENDVHGLNRAYRDYITLLDGLLQRLGPEVTLQEIVPYVAVVNELTMKTVELEVLINDFSDDLYAISRHLQGTQTGF